jgi:hypothetical protein
LRAEQVIGKAEEANSESCKNCYFNLKTKQME